MSNYSSQFLDPRWQKFRLECLELAKWTCMDCGEKKKTLHVHHPYYIKGRSPWDYYKKVMIVVCQDCHDDRHSDTQWIQNWECILASLGVDAWEDIGCRIDYLQNLGVKIAPIITKALIGAAKHVRLVA